MNIVGKIFQKNYYLIINKSINRNLSRNAIMRIAIIACGYPSKEDPQFGCFEKDQALALKKAGHEVSIIYVDGRFRRFKRKVGITHFVENGIYVYGIYLYPGAITAHLNHHFHYWIMGKMLFRIFAYMLTQQPRPDLLYAHFFWNISHAAVLKKKYGIPLVGMEHWSKLNDQILPKYLMIRGEKGYSVANQILAVSESLREQIFRHFRKEAIVVHNMIGEEFFNQSLHVKNSKGKCSMVAIGSLIHRKGFDVLISALYEVEKKYSAWELRIIGGGVEEDNLKKQIAKWNLENKVKLVGRKNKQEIISILQESDLFVFPSRAENFSVAVLEALSAGLPVVATLCGGIKECIDEKNGLLVPVEDTNALADAIVNICKNIDNYDRKAIAENCKNEHKELKLEKYMCKIMVVSFMVTKGFA